MTPNKSAICITGAMDGLEADLPMPANSHSPRDGESKGYKHQRETKTK
jgi:hypothetical protein